MIKPTTNSATDLSNVIFDFSNLIFFSFRAFKSKLSKPDPSL